MLQGPNDHADTLTATPRKRVSSLPILNWSTTNQSTSSFTDSSTLVEHLLCDQFNGHNFLTDPAKTGHLWDLVRATKTMPPKPKPSPKSQGQTLTNSLTSLQTGNTSSNRTQKATTRDPNFVDTQLTPRRITIISEGDAEEDKSQFLVPYPGFNTEPPPDREHTAEHYSNAVEDYHKTLGSKEEISMIWVTEEQESCNICAMEYEHLNKIGVPEREYELLALEKILLQTRRTQLSRPVRQAKVIRLAEQSLRPRPRWIEPPLFDSKAGKSFDYNIFPDCQYYLSQSLFNQNYVSYLSNIVAITARQALLPYFTIEFKRDEKSPTTLRNQLAAAASISLYNRYELKRKGLGVRDKHKTAQKSKEKAAEVDDWKHVQHYGLSMESSDWKIWRIEPELPKHSWNGCKMELLAEGDCITDSGVFSLAQWVNEIHLWAHTEYSRDCEMDVKQVLSSRGVRVSNIHESTSS